MLNCFQAIWQFIKTSKHTHTLHESNTDSMTTPNNKTQNTEFNYTILEKKQGKKIKIQNQSKYIYIAQFMQWK